MRVFPPPPSIEGLTAVVTGGSRGLGLLLARELLRRGCDVALLARDDAELGRAVDKLGPCRGGTVHGVVCDVRDRAAVRDRLAEIAGDRGGLDIVIANAGIIQVGPAEALGAEGFQDAMDSVFNGALNTSLAALPHLRRSPAGGRLVLIGSVGGLLAVPHLLPYSCAKSAVAALADGLHAEEAPHGVSVTAVHPGLMRTGSHLHAFFGGDRRREYGWFSAVAGAPLLSMNAERAADRIVTALQRRRPRLVLTPAARLGATAHGLAPVTTTRLVSAAARVLPRDGSRTTVRGSAVEAGEQPPAPRLRAVLGALNERAADRFNQR
ncbi:short-subunit dehydrogenase [Streptomyces sp. 2333.5]|uniref:SDR family NAD(P)-dependent oxidoreductase n=1 Tax=unclassified Streptomyces TaxID=2593676 RepID=UPI0008948D65|nr:MULTISPECIES: SDR family NAD(P)-dependent oxidoreductase [unclassified Streptomyces]PJJ00561.1 short-subunit dehydrogenase [Streptomyces sp. 2333.5]SEC01093.1 Short-chain dehydrogenase [Streptomyces sp. 2314.4]SEC90158.1 Short-chain dehydrogenase [Streptomyces sp. 2112.2]